MSPAHVNEHLEDNQDLETRMRRRLRTVKALILPVDDLH
jgi:hypothetical protein